MQADKTSKELYSQDDASNTFGLTNTGKEGDAKDFGKLKETFDLLNKELDADDYDDSSDEDDIEDEIEEDEEVDDDVPTFEHVDSSAPEDEEIDKIGDQFKPVDIEGGEDMGDTKGDSLNDRVTLTDKVLESSLKKKTPEKD